MTSRRIVPNWFTIVWLSFFTEALRTMYAVR